MRTAASWVLLVLATLFCIVAALGTWADRELLDTDQFTQSSVAILQDPAVQQATAAYLADQLVDDDQFANRLRDALPDRFDGLAAPLAATSGELADRTVLRVIRSGAFQKVWAETTQLAHTQLVAAIEGERRAAVVLDMRPQLGVLAQRLGIQPNPTGDKGIVTIMRGDQLQGIRDAVDLFHKLRWLSIALAVLCLAGAVAIARDRRRGLARAGGVLILAGLILLVVRRVGGATLVRELTENGAAGDAAKAMFDIVTLVLTDVAGAGIVLGVVCVAGAWLAGTSGWATRARQWLTPAFVDHPEVAYGAGFVVLVALLALGWLPAAASWIAILVYLVLVAVGITALRRQMEREAAPPAALG